MAFKKGVDLVDNHSVNCPGTLFDIKVVSVDHMQGAVETLIKVENQ